MPTDVDALGLVRATRARGSIGRRAWFMRPMRMVLLLVLLAALALAAALLVASQRPDEPHPSTSYVAVVSRSTDLDSVPYDEPRQMSIVAIRSDGQERLITTLRIAPRDPKVELRLSGTGWLAADVGEGLRLIDLRDPSHVVGPLDGRGYRSWIPGGRFAEWTESGSMRLTDPETGTTTMLSLPSLARVFDQLAALQYGPVEPIDGWLADGTGFVTGVDHSRWRVVYLDGRPDGEVIPATRPIPQQGQGSGRDEPAGVRSVPRRHLSRPAERGRGGQSRRWHADDLVPRRARARRCRRCQAHAGWDRDVAAARSSRRRAPVRARACRGRRDRDRRSSPRGCRRASPARSGRSRMSHPTSRWSRSAASAAWSSRSRPTGRVRAVEGGLLGFVPEAEVDAWTGGPYGEAGPRCVARARGSPPGRPCAPSASRSREQVPSEGTVLWRREQSRPTVRRRPASPVVSEPIVLDGSFGVLARLQRALGRGGHDGPTTVARDLDPPVASACRDGDDRAGNSEARASTRPSASPWSRPRTRHGRSWSSTRAPP